MKYTTDEMERIENLTFRSWWVRNKGYREATEKIVERIHGDHCECENE